MPCPVEEYAVPQSTFARVFWLMRRLATSIQQGAYLTPHLFVSKEVWHQEGAENNIHYISAKTKYLSSLCEALDSLRSVNTLGDFAKIIKLLNKFVTTEKSLRDTLDHDMGRSKDGGKSKKSMWGVFSRKMKVTTGGDLNVLLTWAVNALEQGQLCERWMIYYKQASTLDGSVVPAKEVEEVMGILQGISKQFYSGMCMFLLQDMTQLVGRYNEKGMKSALKILPLDPKLEGVD
ncbi:hypothetical protein AGDE_02802 [Angomonas deanei]|nr:hypothetical protein AGDE_02802 [Angomonas deanei]|eukprot:EPY41123.1 hypothetical protein AGDE_02802 [Angomonas deanei]